MIVMAQCSFINNGATLSGAHQGRVLISAIYNVYKEKGRSVHVVSKLFFTKVNVFCL